MREVGIILPQGKAGNLQGSSLLLQPAAVCQNQGGILPEVEKVIVAQGRKQDQALFYRQGQILWLLHAAHKPEFFQSGPGPGMAGKKHRNLLSDILQSPDYRHQILKAVHVGGPVQGKAGLLPGQPGLELHPLGTQPISSHA